MASRGRGRGWANKPPSPSSSADASPPPGRLSAATSPSPPLSAISANPTPSPPPAHDQLADEMSSLDLSPLNLVPRPNFGTQGQKIALLTNHFHMTMPTSRDLYHYDIEITQGSDDRTKIVWTSGKAFGRTRNEIRDVCYKVYLAYVQACGLSLYEMFYDRQKILLTLFDMKERGHMQSKVVMYKNESYTVLVTACSPLRVTVNAGTLAKAVYDTTVDSRDLSPLMILNLVTNQMLFYANAMDKSAYIHFGRHFFKPSRKRNGDYDMLPMGRVIYEGFFKSLRFVMGPRPINPVANGPPHLYLTMNVDTKKAPFFFPFPLSVSVAKTLNPKDLQVTEPPRNPLNEGQLKTLNHHLRDLKLQTVHTHRTVTMHSFGDQPCNKQMLTMENGRQKSVFDYFREKYPNVKLMYPNLPCVRQRGGGRKKPNEWTYFPVEACMVVPHQKVELKRTTEQQSRAMIMACAVPPEMRLSDIQQKVNDIDFLNGDPDPFTKAFGLQRSKEMMKLEGRILQPPKILYNDPRNLIVPRNGQWMMQQNHKFHIAATVGKMLVLNFSAEQKNDVPIITAFVQNLIRMCQACGMKMESKFVGGYCTFDKINDEFKAKAKLGAKTILCIMDDQAKGDSLKNAIKFAEVKYSVITQCVRPKTIDRCYEKPGDEIYKNLALKMNAKHGGVNNELELNDPIIKHWLREGVMYVGMDVNHPAPMSKADIAMGKQPKEPSVVGATANCGKSMSDYRGRFYVQDVRQERVADKHLRDMFTTFVQEYAENHKGRRPDAIVLYRDGVSESQFKMVLDNEILSIKEAFAHMSPPYCPKLTVITVQKRHNTRFFREELLRKSSNELKNEKTWMKNVPAGTVVDVGPVSAYLFDFYLCSHNGLQGTSKPTYYTCLYDENKFTADELQRLSYSLCYVYQRCNKSVSLPAPVYHSHFLAARGKGNFLALTESDDSSSGVGSSLSGSNNDASPLDYERIQSQIAYPLLHRDTMIWC